MRLIDADLLYMQLQNDEELARKRVLDTESFSPYPNNLNPSYTRYVTQMDERTRLKHMVADAPTIEPQRWIPCSERLPEESGSYFVSGKWASGKVAVGDCEYSKDDGYFQTAWNFDVEAWMPLPEPYKGE